jgi:hypothetical protein
MNLKELNSLQLSDYVKFHDRLNPVLWDENQNLNPKVRNILLDIANDFREFLGVSDIGLKDITVSGSNAGYNYNDHSDIDLHLVVDLPEADRSQVYRELFDAKKYQYNDQHNITIGGYDVELYVQNANQPHYSQGIYSLLNNQWLIVPKKIKTDINDDSVISKYQDLENRINSAVNDNSLERLQSLIDKIKNMRVSGLADRGEFSVENLTFKLLRHHGLIKKLYDRRNQLHDQELSLTERKKRRKKSRVKYGFSGYWYPGFSWADSGEGGGGDGGGESINENIESQIKLFANEIMDELKIVNRPKIILHSDPRWTAKTGSFGQYSPDNNHLQLSISNRHILDIIRTLAHELVHCAQRHRGKFPDDAGQTGSPYENEANALAGQIMRGFAERRPELFTDIKLSEASGYIPTEKQKNDPRFSTALTKDIRPGETGRQANKLHLKTDTQGRPALLLAKKLQEEWSTKYKKSIDCDRPKGFSQRAHCQGKKKKHNESQQKKPNLKIYLDMDGVLADFAGRYRTLFGVDPDISSRNDPNIPKILGTDFFRKLNKFSTSDQVVNLALKYGGNHYGICSSPLRGDIQNSSNNKKQWLLSNLSPLPSDIVFTRNKEKYATSDGIPNVLIDDKPSNIEKWNKAGGYGILYNAEYDTIDHLENKLKQISNKFSSNSTLINEDDLLEIRMDPTSLAAAVKDIDARVGIEFEMIVPNVAGGVDYPEMVMDMDYNEGTRSITDIVNFFDDRDYNSRNAVRSLEIQLRSDFSDWTSEAFDARWESNKETFVYDYVTDHMDVEDIAELLGLDPDRLDGLTRTQAEEAADLIIREGGDRLDNIREQALEDFLEDPDLEEEWLGEAGLVNMSDVHDEYSDTIHWPYWTTEESESSTSIDAIANDFSEAIGRPINASSSYHSARREPGKYVVEPDGSLRPHDSDDMGLEFVSPPLTFPEMLDDLEKVRQWANRIGAYTNNSTGLHMNVSIPGYDDKNLDFVKLALLVGDQYVLDQFGRSANTYATSALSKIQARAKNLSPDQVQGLFDQMRSGLNKFASRSIQGSDVGKYTSIHPQGKYIEFRSPGGDWLDEDPKKLVSTLMRFIVALDAAMDPDKYRKEYLSKLRKLLAPKSEDDPIDYFVKYSSGELPKQALKSFLRQAQLKRSTAKKPLPGSTTGNTYEIINLQRNQVIDTFNANSDEEALQYFDSIFSGPNRNLYDVRRAQPQTTQTPQRPQLTAPETQPDANWAVVRQHDGRPVNYFTRNTPAEAETEFDRLTMGDAWTYELVPVQPRSSFIPPRSLDILQSGSTGNWGIWVRASQRFARQPGEYPIGQEIPLRRFPTQQAAEQFLAQRRERHPDVEIDAEVREIPAEPTTQSQPIPGSTRDLQQQRSQGGFTGSWRITIDGEEVHRFGGVGNVQADAVRFATRWLLDQQRLGNLTIGNSSEIDVLPIIG